MIVDVYCMECFAPAQVTNRGPLCTKHYESRRPMCEVCGLRPADIVDAGYYRCGTCVNEGRDHRHEIEGMGL